MRAYFRTSKGVLLLRGDLLVSPTVLQRSLVHGDIVFDTRPDAEAEAAPVPGERPDAAPAAAAPAAAEAPGAEVEPAEAPEEPERPQRPSSKRWRGR